MFLHLSPQNDSPAQTLPWVGPTAPGRQPHQKSSTASPVDPGLPPTLHTDRVWVCLPVLPALRQLSAYLLEDWEVEWASCVMFTRWGQQRTTSSLTTGGFTVQTGRTHSNTNARLLCDHYVFTGVFIIKQWQQNTTTACNKWHFSAVPAFLCSKNPPSCDDKPVADIYGRSVR